MPKPNRLLVGDVSHPMDPDYLGGARAARSGFATGRGSASWRAGERNEIDLEHVRFGTDLLGLPNADREFCEDPALPRLAPVGRRRPLEPNAALLAYMEATGSLREAGLACLASDWVPDSWRFVEPGAVARVKADGSAYLLMRPARLRMLLAGRGLGVSPEMAKALLRRLEHERQTRPEPLRFHEEIALDAVGPEALRLMRLLAVRQERIWLSDALPDALDAAAGRRPGWAEAVAQDLESSGLGFLVVRGRGGMRLTGRGASALRLLRTPPAAEGRAAFAHA